MSDHVRGYSLGQPRKTGAEEGETLGSWRKAGWLADPRAYRCLECHAVVPWSLWTPAQREAWEWDGCVPNCCEGCNGKPAPLGGDAGMVWDERDCD